MKKRNMLFLALAMTGMLITGQSVAQDNKEKAEPAKAATAETQEAWKERTDFHKVMSTTFHPMEDGDFKPIRERAGEMYAKAEAWAKSTAPKSLDKPEIKEKLTQLVKESGELKDMIAAKATDEDVKVKLTALHETFHQIAGLCKPGM
ncbi:MAG TPA: hypothetical protein PLU53_01650 [Bacteroidia bacterium]|nr:hypothetical protein [Bacteroidia bacterium]